MKKVSIVVMLVLSVLIVCCKSTDGNEEEPAWVRNGNIGLNPDYYYAVGSSTLPNRQSAMNQAMLYARAELASMAESYVNTIITETLSINVGPDYDQLVYAVEYLYKQESRQILKDTIVQYTWVSPEGELYVLMSMPKASVVSALGRILESVSD